MASLPPPPPFGSQWAEVLASLRKEFASGLYLGLVCLFVALLDQKGTFVSFMTDNMTSMPLTVVLAGVVGGFAYVLQKDKAEPIAVAGKACLDLTRQFFSLGTGAYLFIQLAAALRHEWIGDKYDSSFWQAVIALISMAFMAVVMTALEVTGKYAVTPGALKVGWIEFVVALFALVALLRFFDDGAIMCAVKSSIMPARSSGAEVCKPMLIRCDKK